MKNKKIFLALPLAADHERKLKSRDPRACPYVSRDLAVEHLEHCHSGGINKKSLMMAQSAVEYWNEAVNVWEAAWENEPSNYSF